MDIEKIVMWLVSNGYAFNYYQSESGSHYIKINDIIGPYSNYDLNVRISDHKHPTRFNGLDVSNTINPLLEVKNAIEKLENPEGLILRERMFL